MNMKGKKIFASLIIVAMLIPAILGLLQSKVYAADTGITVYLEEYRTGSTPNTAYSIGRFPNGENSGKRIWDLIASSNATGEKLNVYCLNGGYPDGWDSGSSNAKEYKTAADNDTCHINYKTEKGNIVTYQSRDDFVNRNIVNDTYYYNIIWIIDNMYIPGVSTEEE